MNIVKFKDIVLDADNAPQLTPEQREMFNNKYKGKYAYAVDWVYIVALEDMTQKQYVDASKNLLDDEFRNVYTLINGVDDLRNDEGIIDDTKEYFLLSTNKYNSPDEIHTYIPGTHGLGAKQSSPYTDFIDIPNFDFLNDDNTPKNKFIVNTEIDRQITAKTNYRLLPYKYYVQGAQEQEIVEEVFSTNTGSGYTYNITIEYQLEQNYFYLRIETNTEHKYSCNIIIKNDYDERNFGRGASSTYYSSTIYLDQDDPNINMQYFDTIHISISDYTGTEESNIKVRKPYWDTDPDYFFIQDRQYSFTPKKEPEKETEKRHELDWDYYYVNRAGTSSSNRNLIYNDGQFCEDRLKAGGSILGQWYINEEKLLTNVQGDVKLIFNNSSNPQRFGMYSKTSSQIYPAYLYRRDVVEPASLKDFDNIALSLLEDYIDINQTTVSNSVVKYIAANKYSTDEDITVDELKKFRTWLATYLLYFDQDKEGKQQYKLFDDETTHMLLYYKEGMYDDVIKYLSKFSDQTFTLVSTVSSCGCNSLGTIGGTVVSTLPYTNLKMTSCGCNTNTLAGPNVLNGCDPVMIYRKNIYLKMANTFSVIDFWKMFGTPFLVDFKKYVDDIIKLNLPLVTSTFISAFADCGCLNQADAEQAKNMSILKDLSKSLQYLIEDQESGNKNFIQSTLQSWSSLLYENMQWT